MPDLTYLWLIPAIVGWTAAIANQLPALAKLKPFIALGVASLLYLGAIHFPPALFGLLFATGSAMGLYEFTKKVGGV